MSDGQSEKQEKIVGRNVKETNNLRNDEYKERRGKWEMDKVVYHKKQACQKQSNEKS